MNPDQKNRYYSEIIRNNYRPKKRFGQNFLIDKNIVNLIISSAELRKEDTVLEIGAGRGELTRYIAQYCNVIAVELDRNLSQHLQDEFKGYKNVQIIQSDILKIDFSKLDINNCKVIGNIPYYITTPILFKLIENKGYFKDIILTVQKEIAERIVANSGNKDYGVLSIMVQYHTESEIIKIISKNCFYPKPKVDSAVLKLKILKKPKYEIKNEKLFVNLVKTSFQQRRKMFKNALLRLGYTEKTIKTVYSELNADLKVRGEDLSIEQFVGFSNALSEVKD